MYRCVDRYAVVMLVLSVVLLLARCTQAAEESPLTHADEGQVAVISLSPPESTKPSEPQPVTNPHLLPERQEVPEAKASLSEASAPADRAAEAPAVQIEEIPEPPIPQALVPSDPTQPETEPAQTEFPFAADPDPTAFPPGWVIQFHCPYRNGAARGHRNGTLQPSDAGF